MTAEEQAAAEKAEAEKTEAEAKAKAEAEAKAKSQSDSDDVAKLKEVVRKEREAREAAEKKLKESEKSKAEAAKTEAERLAALESEAASLRLEKQTDKAIREAIKAVETKDGKPTGLKVDLEGVEDLRAISNITADNVDEVVARIVKRSTVQDTVKSGDDNKPGRSDAEKGKPTDPKTAPRITEVEW